MRNATGTIRSTTGRSGARNAKRIAKDDGRTSLWLYNKLANDPASLAALSDDQFYLLRAELSEADFKHFSNERAKQRNPTSASGKGAGDLDSESVKRTLDSRLHMIGVNTSPGKDKSAAARLGAIRKYVDERLLVAQREAGKKFDDQEITKHIDMLLAQQAMFDGWWGDHSGTMLAMTVDDIPDKERDEISTAFRRAGIENPSDAQVLELYWQSVTHRKHGLKEGEK